MMAQLNVIVYSTKCGEEKFPDAVRGRDAHCGGRGVSLYL